MHKIQSVYFEKLKKKTSCNKLQLYCCDAFKSNQILLNLLSFDCFLNLSSFDCFLNFHTKVLVGKVKHVRKRFFSFWWISFFPVEWRWYKTDKFKKWTITYYGEIRYTLGRFYCNLSAHFVWRYLKIQVPVIRFIGLIKSRTEIIGNIYHLKKILF